jgi:hypothetical protein
VSFALDASGTTALSLQNGWTTTPYGTRAPAVKVVNGFVRFQGVMLTNGTNALAFTLPGGFRPNVNVYVPVDLCNAGKGRLNIAPDGTTSVQAENSFSQAQCFTSLEGAAFAIGQPSGATTATLENNWTNNAYSTGAVAFRNDHGIVRFQGGTSGGTAQRVFTLPAAYRPATNVYLYVDTFGGARGRLLVQPDGQVIVDQGYSSAQSFLSFEGASFGL